MALKSKITDKAEFDKLSDAVKAEYKEENGVWLLDTDDAAELRAAKDRETQARKDAEAERDRLKGEKDEAERNRLQAIKDADEEKARKNGDIAALETSWKEKRDIDVSNERKRGDKLDALLRASLIDGAAEKMAAEVSTAPTLLSPVIKARLSVDLDGDKAVLRVLGKDGKISAMSLDDLKAEVVANSEYAGIIRGTDANGGGAHKFKPAGGASKKFSELTEAERIEFHRIDPTGFKAASAAQGNAG